MSMEFLLGLLLSIPLSILATLLTPKVQDWLAQIYFPIRRRRIKRIIFEHTDITFMRKNLQNLLGSVFKAFSLGICLLIGAFIGFIAYVSLPSYETLSSWLFVVRLLLFILILVAANLAFSVFFRIASQMQAVLYFEKYKGELSYRVKKLGGKIREFTDESITIETQSK